MIIVLKKQRSENYVWFLPHPFEKKLACVLWLMPFLKSLKNNFWIINDCRDENCSKKSKTNPSQIWSSQKIKFLSYVVFFLKTKARHINFLKLSNYRKIKRHKTLRSHLQSTRVMVLSQLSRLFVLIIFFESWFINPPFAFTPAIYFVLIVFVSNWDQQILETS